MDSNELTTFSEKTGDDRDGSGGTISYGGPVAIQLFSGSCITGVGKCPNWTSPNYWGYKFQQIFEGDIQNPQKKTFTNPWIVEICQMLWNEGYQWKCHDHELYAQTPRFAMFRPHPSCLGKMNKGIREYKSPTPAKLLHSLKIFNKGGFNSSTPLNFYIHCRSSTRVEFSHRG